MVQMVDFSTTSSIQAQSTSNKVRWVPRLLSQTSIIRIICLKDAEAEKADENCDEQQFDLSDQNEELDMCPLDTLVNNFQLQEQAKLHVLEKLKIKQNQQLIDVQQLFANQPLVIKLLPYPVLLTDLRSASMISHFSGASQAH
jgi:hypothetical protein